MPKRWLDNAETEGGAAPNGARGATGPFTAWNLFWFAPRDRCALDVLRVLLGIYLLVWLGSNIGHQRAFFGLNGWFDAEAYRRASLLPDDAHPPIGWSPTFIAGRGAGIDALFYGALVVIALFTVGVAVRATSVLTWLAVVSFTSNPVLFYGGDVLLLIPALYLAIGYNSMRWHEPEDLLAPPLGTAKGPSASVGANLGVRLLQVHIAIIVFASALHKLQIGEWWAGDPFWFAWTDPARFSFRDLIGLRESGRARTLMIALSLAAYATLTWQLAFPFLIWRPAWRKIMLAGAFLGALGCWGLYHLPVYGAGLFLGCLSFVEPAIWRQLLERVRHRQRIDLPRAENVHDRNAQGLSSVSAS